jgi:hypothetical protein
MKLSECVQFGRAWWRKHGNLIVGITKRMGKSGMGVDGPFKAYSTKHSAPQWLQAARGHNMNYQEMKAAGMFDRQTSRSTKPDLTLTGDFWRDMQVTEATNNGCTIGWPAFGNIVEWQAEQGRVVSNDDHPIYPTAELQLNAWFDAELDRLGRAWAGDRVKISINV